MGKYHPPLGGLTSQLEDSASPFGSLQLKTTAGYVFEPTPENMRRWQGWWKFANIEQLASFVLITIITIWFMSMYSAALEVSV